MERGKPTPYVGGCGISATGIYIGWARWQGCTRGADTINTITGILTSEWWGSDNWRFLERSRTKES